MGVRDVTRAGILQAIAEYDSLGDEQAFLRKGGFRPSREYALVYNGRPYPPKAIVGVAHAFDRPDLGPLDWKGLSGGIGHNGAVTILEQHGFTVHGVQRAQGRKPTRTRRSIADAQYVVHVSRSAIPNVAIGAAAGMWGLPGSAAENVLNQIVPARSGREVLEDLKVDDLVLAVGGGPNPRMPDWTDVDFPRGWLWRVIDGYKYDASQVWPTASDERYPHRFGIEAVDTLTDIASSRLPQAAARALKYSATNRGMVLPADAFAFVPIRPGQSPLMPTDDPILSLIDEDLDSVALAKARREQQRLRKGLIGDRLAADCALCGCTLPVCCLRAAHIKRRAECHGRERRQSANLMLACTLGCDHLFELGYIFVGPDGVIRSRAHRSATAHLVAAIGRLDGRTCAAHNWQSEPYFAWHRVSWTK